MLEISSGRRLSISVQHLMAFGLENNWSKHIIPKSDGKVIEMKIAKDRKVIPERQKMIGSEGGTSKEEEEKQAVSEEE